MSYPNLDQAKAAIAELTARIEAARANGTLDANKAGFDQELRAIFDQTPVTPVDGTPQPAVTVLYGGGTSIDGPPPAPGSAANPTAKFWQVGAGKYAQQMAAENPGAVGILDDTVAGKLADSVDAKLALDALFGGHDSSEAKAFMFASRGEGGVPGIFDDMSARFAASLSGEVITITPNPDLTRTFASTEVAELMLNHNVNKINGVDADVFRQM